MTYIIKRWALLSLGWVAIALAAAGVILPLLPTTPFVLLAACCFVKSSPEMHQKMLQHPKLGPILLDWQQHRCIDKKVKRKANCIIVLSFSVSIYLSPNYHMQITLFVIGLMVLFGMNRIPNKKTIVS